MSRKPKVVFDPKMPIYEYYRCQTMSLSVDRKRSSANVPPVDCLATIGSELTATVKLQSEGK